MKIGIRGCFGVAIYHPKKQVNVGTLWRTAGILGAGFLATIGKRYEYQRSDPLKVPKHIPLFHFPTFTDFKMYLPTDCELVGVEIERHSVDLKYFTHPERACYLLGAEDSGLPKNVIKECSEIIQLQGSFCFNVSIAGSIVLYHRVYL